MINYIFRNKFYCLTFNFIFLLVSICSIKAQQTEIKGYVSDSVLNPIEAAAVSLFIHDSIVLVSTTTNSDGFFELSVERENIPEENLLITTSHIAYKNKIQSINIQNDTLINVVLEEAIYSLEEISIIADRPAIEFRDGNLIANVSQIPHIQTADAVTLLSRLPGVAASEQEGLTYNGIPAALYIDGRKQNMTTANIISFLKALPTSSIEQVELKSMGLASYDASAQAVINIKTKKQRIDGYHGSIGAQMASYESYNIDGASNLVYMLKSNKVMFNMNFSYINDYYAGTAFDSTYYVGGESLLIDKKFNSRSNTFNGFANLNWEISGANSLNFNLSSFNNFGSVYESEPTEFFTENSVNSYLQTSDTYTHNDMWTGVISFQSNESKTYRYEVSYSILFGGLRSEIDFEYFIDEGVGEEIAADVKVAGERHTGEVIFEQDINSSTNIKAGIKNDYGVIDDNVNYLSSMDNISFLNNSSFSGTENIFASYFELRYKIDENWSFYSGVRTENTDYSISMYNADLTSYDNYWNIFPNATLSFQRTNYRGSFGLTSGIIRPNYEWLLPGIRYYNEYTYTVGNPNLKPAMFYSIIFNQSIFDFININLGYNKFKNAFMKTPVALENNITENTYQNVADYYRLYGVLSVPFRLLNQKLVGRFNLNTYYVQFKNTQQEVYLEDNRKQYWRIESNGFIQYELTENFALNTWFAYNPANQRLFFDLETRGSVNIGAVFNTKSEDLTIALDFENLFGNYNYRYKYYYDSNQRLLNNDVNHKSIKLSVKYSILGGENITDKAKGIQSDTTRFMNE